MKEWENKISLNSSHINNILKLRNKVYAHTDPKIDDLKNIEISFKDIKQLIELTEEIIKKISLEIFSMDFLTISSLERKGFKIIKILAKAKTEQIESYINKIYSGEYKLNS